MSKLNAARTWWLALSKPKKVLTGAPVLLLFAGTVAALVLLTRTGSGSVSKFQADLTTLAANCTTEEGDDLGIATCTGDVVGDSWTVDIANVYTGVSYVVELPVSNAVDSPTSYTTGVPRATVPAGMTAVYDSGSCTAIAPGGTGTARVKLTVVDADLLPEVGEDVLSFAVDYLQPGTACTVPEVFSPLAPV